MHLPLSKHLPAFGLSFALSLSLFAENVQPNPALAGFEAQSSVPAAACRTVLSDANALKINVLEPIEVAAVPASFFIEKIQTDPDVEPDPIEFASNAALWLAPNPATSFLTVGLRLDAETAVTIELLDLVGRSLHREIHCLREGNITFAVDNLPKGVFLVRVIENGHIKWTRSFHKV